MVILLSEKNLVDLVEVFIGKKRTWNVDTCIKLSVGNVEMGSVKITGKIQYVPDQN